MGCCVSTNTTSPPPKTPHFSNFEINQNGGSKSPPPTDSPLQEETVKEVLSETAAAPKHPSPPIPRFHENENKLHPNGTVSGSDELSVSEVDSHFCSTHSESVSVLVALTEIKSQNNGEFHETQRRSQTRFKNRSYSGEVKREKTVGWSPNRNSPGPRRRDSGESSGGRSRSPVIPSNSGLGKLSRKTDSSPGRVEFGWDEGIRRMEKERRSEENMWQPTGNDLLENPHVSLECFIFL